MRTEKNGGLKRTGVERISHRAGTLSRPIRIVLRLRPYEKFVQRLLGRKEEAGQDEVFSVPTSHLSHLSPVKRVVNLLLNAAIQWVGVAERQSA
jgi:hypothetical protein